MRTAEKLIALFLLLRMGGFCAGASIDIEVDNSSLGGRVGNKMPALATLDFRQILGASDARINPQSLKLRRLDSSGKPTGDALPVRFDDPDPKPESFFWDFVGGGGQAGGEWHGRPPSRDGDYNIRS